MTTIDRQLNVVQHIHRLLYDELIARDKANLDITWLRDPDAEDGDNLRRPR